MKIVVIGAYGYTGKLVCQSLIKQGLSFTIAGRRQTSLDTLNHLLSTDLDTVLIDLMVENEVKSMVKEFDIFINCVGPFNETAEYLLTYISRDNKFYCDITGEISFVQNSKEMFDEMAQNHQATILHSCAFESVLTNLLGAALLKDKNDVFSIYSYYAIGKGKPSPGTRLTMKLSKFRDPFFIQKGKRKSSFLIPLEVYESESVLHHSAVPYPLPEICFFDWERQIQNIGSFLLVDSDEAKYMKLNNKPSSDQTKKDEVINLHYERKPKGPKVDRRVQQEFTIYLELKAKEGDAKMYVKGKDMYQLTADIITYFVRDYINNKHDKFGVMTPSAFLGAHHTFFDDLNLEIGHY